MKSTVESSPLVYKLFNHSVKNKLIPKRETCTLKRYPVCPFGSKIQIFTHNVPLFFKSGAKVRKIIGLRAILKRIIFTKNEYRPPQTEKFGIHCQWREIVRIINTQKVVTTSVENDKNQIVRIRKCSELRDKVSIIYQALGYRQALFIRKKSVVPKPPNLKNNTARSIVFVVT